MPCISYRLPALVAAAGFALTATFVTSLGSTHAVAGSSLTSPFYKATKPKPQVRGSRKRVGGYSYTHEDSIIDHRDRSIFLDPKIVAPGTGPFDSGLFFDSGLERQNNSPYLY